MTSLRLLTAAVGVAALVLGGCEEQATAETGTPPTTDIAAAELPLGSGFDFYVLALSWSPSYCASTGDRANRQQCGGETAFRFVVHGLWPEFETGYPENCKTKQPLDLPRSVSDEMLDIMPSTGLVRHEWTTHGTCSGLTQADYFATTRKAFGKVAIPEEYASASTYATPAPQDVETAFIRSNPGLTNDAIAITCDRHFLRDVRICMTKDLSQFVSCPEVDRRSCALPDPVMPPPSNSN